MTKLNESSKYERMLELAGLTNVFSRYHDQADPVQCKRGINMSLNGERLLRQAT